MTNSIFQVLSNSSSNQYVVGAGVVLEGNFLITCTHIGQFANAATGSVEVGGKLRIRFPFAAPNVIVDCVIEGFQALDPSMGGDMMLMKALQSLPEGVSDPSWGVPISGSKTRTIGFPGGLKADKNGQWAYGILRDQGMTEWQQIEDESNGGYWVKPGFSGSPIWRSDSWVALGIVCAVDAGAGRKVAFAIPSPTLIRFAASVSDKSELTALQSSVDGDRLSYVRELAQKKLGKLASVLMAGTIRILADHLERGEVLQNVMTSPITNIIGTQFVQGMLAVSDRRFIFIYKVPGIPPIIKNYDFWDITRVMFAWGNRMLIEAGSRRRLSLADFDDKHMQELVDYANERIRYFRALT
jgi:hypothetical protein